MKQLLFLLLVTMSIYGQTLQNPTFGSLTIKNSTYTYKESLLPIRNQFATFFNQPFYQSDQGYYIFRPLNANIPARFYIIPNGTVSGTTSKFEMFNSDYSADYTTYSGFNILMNNSTNTINLGSNRGASGGVRQKLRIGGDYAGSSFVPNSSAIDFNTDNTININPFGGSFSVGTDITDPFSISLPHQVTFKNPVVGQPMRFNIVGNGWAAGLYLGRDAIRTASFATQATTSDVEFSTNPTNTGTTLVANGRIFASSGNWKFQNGGTMTDDGNRVQVNGTISASPATNSTQVVVKSQLDLKADLASPVLTGTPTAPTATAGTNNTQVATTAFVQANARPYKIYKALMSQSGTSAPTVTVLENNIGAIVWSYSSVGTYFATLSGAFTLNKTAATIVNSQASLNPASFQGFAYTNVNAIQVNTKNVSGVITDGLLFNAVVEIVVYP